MKYPIQDYISTSKEMMTNFQGYDNRLGCLEGSFHDELNVTADHYPMLSARNKRHKASNDVYNARYDENEKNYVNTSSYQGWMPSTADRIFNTSDGNELISIKTPTAYINYPNSQYHPVAITYGNKRAYVGKAENFETEDINISENPDRRVVRMGAKLCMFPDNLWINVDGDDIGEHGTLDDFIATAKVTTIENCTADGEPISDKLHDEQYYKDNPDALVSGAYMITTNSNGNESIKVYSDLSKSWSTVTSTYVAYKVQEDNNTKKSNLKEGDGIIIRARLERHLKNASATPEKVDGLDKLLLTEDKDFTNGDHKLTRGLYYELFAPGTVVYTDDDPYYSMTSPIKKLVKKDGYIYIVVPGIIHKKITIQESWGICFARAIPKMSHIVECQNRLWGCAEDGHEIYCCKLGDPTNWYYFEGTAADSYAATVGSSGEFTGAIAYNQNPLFFKENSFLKVSVSASGAHSYRVQDSEGVEKTSAKSIVNVEGILYYLNSNGVYAYDGSAPQKVSDVFGEHRYMSGISGRLNGKYYLSVLENDGSGVSREDANCKHTLFVYDTFKGLWTKEADNDFMISDIYCTAETIYFTRLLKDSDGHKMYETWCEGVHKFWNSDDFYYGSDSLVADEGTPEKDINWFVESAPIGYAVSNNKYVGRINIRLSMVINSYVDFWIRYDNEDRWTHVFNMSGKGTKSFTIPVTPKRCDHFMYRISGKGDCKVISIAKTIEEGSDV